MEVLNGFYDTTSTWLGWGARSVGKTVGNLAVNALTVGYNPLSEKDRRSDCLAHAIVNRVVEREMVKVSERVGDFSISILSAKSENSNYEFLVKEHHSWILAGIQQTILQLIVNLSEKTRSVMNDQGQNPDEFLAFFLPAFLKEVVNDENQKKLEIIAKEKNPLDRDYMLDCFFMKIVDNIFSTAFPKGEDDLQVPYILKQALKAGLNNWIKNTLTEWLSASFQTTYDFKKVQDNRETLKQNSGTEHAKEFFAGLSDKSADMVLKSLKPMVEEFPHLDKAFRDFLDPQSKNGTSIQTQNLLKEYVRSVVVGVAAKISKDYTSAPQEHEWLSKAMLDLVKHSPKELKEIYEEFKTNGHAPDLLPLTKKLLSLAGYHKPSNLPVPEAFQDQAWEAVISIVNSQLVEYLPIAFEILEMKERLIEEREIYKDYIEERLDGASAYPMLKLCKMTSEAITKYIIDQIPQYGADERYIEAIIRKILISINIDPNFKPGAYSWFVGEIKNLLTNPELLKEIDQTLLQEVIEGFLLNKASASLMAQGSVAGVSEKITHVVHQTLAKFTKIEKESRKMVDEKKKNLHIEYAKWNLHIQLEKKKAITELFDQIAEIFDLSPHDLPLGTFKDTTWTCIKQTVEVQMGHYFDQYIELLQTVDHGSESIAKIDARGKQIEQQCKTLSENISSLIFKNMNTGEMRATVMHTMLPPESGSLIERASLVDELLSGVSKGLEDPSVTKDVQTSVEEILKYISHQLLTNSPQLRNPANGGDPLFLKKAATKLLNHITSSFIGYKATKGHILRAGQGIDQTYASLSEQILKAVYPNGCTDLPVGSDKEKQKIWGILADQLKSTLETQLKPYAEVTSRNAFIIDLLRKKQCDWQKVGPSSVEKADPKNKEESIRLLQIEMKKSINIFTKSMIADAWKRTHMAMDSFFRKIGGEAAVKMKHGIDSISHLLFFTILGTILKYALYPLVYLVKKGVEKAAHRLVNNIAEWISRDELHLLILELIGESLEMLKKENAEKMKEADQEYRDSCQKFAKAGFDVLAEGSVLKRIPGLTKLIGNTLTSRVESLLDLQEQSPVEAGLGFVNYVLLEDPKENRIMDVLGKISFPTN